MRAGHRGTHFAAYLVSKSLTRILKIQVLIDLILDYILGFAHKLFGIRTAGSCVSLCARGLRAGQIQATSLNRRDASLNAISAFNHLRYGCLCRSILTTFGRPMRYMNPCYNVVMANQSQPVPTGTLFVISAPSGAGKTSLVATLVERMDAISVSISHTTRPRRAEERDGVHYYFVSMQTFERMIKEQAFLEHARVFEHLYGTARSSVDSKLRQGKDVVLEIDWQGACQVRHVYPDCVSVFIMPPSREVLQQRLRSRGQDDEDVIRNRMNKAAAEIEHYAKFGYLLVNDDFELAVEELCAIVRCQRLSTGRQSQKHHQLLRQLLV